MRARRKPVPAFAALSLLWCSLALLLAAGKAVPHLGKVYAALAAVFSLPAETTLTGFLGHWAAAGWQAIGILLFIGVLAGVGKALSAFLRIGFFPGRAARFASHALTGFGTAAAGALALGVCGLFHPGVTLGSGVLLAVAAGRQLSWRSATFGCAGRRHVRRADLPGIGIASGESRALAVILSAIIVLLMPFALAPQTFVDTLAYHAGAPAYWNAMHKSVFAPHARFQYPLLEEQVIAACAGLLSPQAINLAVFGLLVLLLAGWAARRFGPATALLGAAGFMASSQSGFLIGHVKHDPAAAAFLLLAFAHWDAARGRNEPPDGGCRQAMAAGLALGLAFAAKYTAVAPAAGMLLMHLAGRSSVRAKASFAAVLATAAIASAAPFLLRTWLLTGNPVQPFLFPALGWSSECSRVAARFGCPGWDLDRDSGPTALLLLGTEHAPLALLGLPLLALVAGGGTGFILAAAFGGIAVWAVLTPCFKFMLPALPLLNVAGAAAILSCPLPKAVRRALAGMALALGLVHAVEMADFASRSAPCGLGLEPRAGYLARRLTTFYSAAARLGTTEPKTARALLIGDARGAPFNGPRPTLSQDISDFPLPLKLAREARDPGEIAKRLKQLGVRLVVLNYVTSEFAGQQTMPDFAFRPAELVRYAEFWERWAEPVPPQDPYDLGNGGFAFYRIRSVPTAPSKMRYPFLPGTEALAARMPDEDRPTQIRRLYAILQFVPRVAHFETRLGALVLEEGDYKEAERLLRRGMECGFDDAGTWGCLGLALKGQRRFASAAAAFERASRLSPGSPEFPRLRDECIRKRRSEPETGIRIFGP